MKTYKKAIKVTPGIPLERVSAIVDSFLNQIESEKGSINRIGVRNGMAVVWNDNEGYYIYQTDTLIVITR